LDAKRGRSWTRFDTWMDLVRKLENGLLRARAVDGGTGEPIKIDPILWKALKPSFDETGFILQNGGKKFQKIDLDRKMLLQIWPMVTLAEKSRSFAESDRILILEMHDLITSGQAKSAEDAARQVAEG